MSLWTTGSSLLVAAPQGLAASSLESQFAPIQAPSRRASVNVALGTELVRRGYSLTEAGPALSATLDVDSHSGVYGGVSMTRIRVDQAVAGGNNVELNPYVGWIAQPIGPLRAEITLSGYFYADSIAQERGHYPELYARLHFRDAVTVQASWALKAYGRGASTWDSSVTWRRPLAARVEFTTQGGFFSADRVFEYNYVYWNAGFRFNRPRFAIDARYYGSVEQSERLSDWDFDPVQRDARLVLSVSVPLW